MAKAKKKAKRKAAPKRKAKPIPSVTDSKCFALGASLGEVNCELKVVGEYLRGGVQPENQNVWRHLGSALGALRDTAKQAPHLKEQVKGLERKALRVQFHIYKRPKEPNTNTGLKRLQADVQNLQRTVRETCAD